MFLRAFLLISGVLALANGVWMLVSASTWYANIPAAVPDTNGEYVEVTNVSGAPVALSGLRLSDNAGTVTIASNYRLAPGQAMVFQTDGAPQRNGGQPLGVTLPFGSIALANTSDSVSLTQGPVVVDALSYTSGFPGGSGAAGWAGAS